MRDSGWVLVRGSYVIVTTLRVGDKVRVIAEDDFFHGDEGDVIKIGHDHEGALYLVDFEVGSISFRRDELEKVTP